MLPFTTDEFLSFFAAYNAAIWPLQVVAKVLGIDAVAIALRRPLGADAALAALRAAVWAGRRRFCSTCRRTSA